MKTFEAEVNIRLKFDAFNLSDADDAVRENLQDIVGAKVTGLEIVAMKELD